MKRRDFLKGMLAGVTAAALPVKLLAEEKDPFKGMNISDECLRVHEPAKYRERNRMTLEEITREALSVAYKQLSTM